MIGVYGSNGFIGRHLIRRLSGLGFATRAVSRRHDTKFTGEISGPIQFLEADLADRLAIASSLQDVDTVVQLISTSSPGLRNDHILSDIEENVLPHVQFLSDCIRAGVRRYVFLSSGGTVYGPNAATPTPESCPTYPICSHGLTKLMVEKYIQMHGFVDGLKYAILRIANPYGPGQEFRKGQGLIPAILDRYRQNLPVKIFGEGGARRDYIYIDDVIDAIIATLDVTDSESLVLNIGSGESRSVMEVVSVIENVIGQRFAREYVTSRATDVPVSYLDVSLASTVIGWKPQTEFRHGIKRTVSAWGLGGLKNQVQHVI